MKNKLLKFSTLLFVVLFIFGSLTLSSCKKGSAPELPPESAFILTPMDSSAQKSLALDTVYANYAAGTVGVWSFILSVGLAVPVKAYQVALEQTPRYEKEKWVWEYTFGLGINKTYIVQLYGQVVDSTVNWEMHISLSGNFDDFVWYTGTHNLDGTIGQWTIYKSPTEDYEFLRIDWTRNPEDNTGTLKYTNIVPDGPENGGYIYYGNDQDGDFDVFYDIYNKGADNLIEIDYNSQYHNGRVRNEVFFGDANWRCWDESYGNITCANTVK